MKPIGFKIVIACKNGNQQIFRGRKEVEQDEEDSEQKGACEGGCLLV